MDPPRALKRRFHTKEKLSCRALGQAPEAKQNQIFNVGRQASASRASNEGRANGMAQPDPDMDWSVGNTAWPLNIPPLDACRSARQAPSAVQANCK